MLYAASMSRTTDLEAALAETTEAKESAEMMAQERAANARRSNVGAGKNHYWRESDREEYQDFLASKPFRSGEAPDILQQTEIQAGEGDRSDKSSPEVGSSWSSDEWVIAESEGSSDAMAKAEAKA